MARHPTIIEAIGQYLRTRHLWAALLCCAGLAAVGPGCDSGPTSSDRKEQGGWVESADPAAMGFTTTGLAEASAFSQQIGSAAVLVLYDGYIVASWGDVEHKYFIHSIRKSLLNALYGIHVHEGHIDLSATLADLGIDDAPVALTQDEKLARVSDLLKSRSGIYIPSASQSESARAALPERGTQARNTHFYYNNWDFNALGTIFRQVTGRDIFTEFDTRIATPLGMDFVPAEDSGYFYERELSTHPAYHFEISTTDLARFGLLYLREGRWRNKQIVPAAWVRASTTA